MSASPQSTATTIATPGLRAKALVRESRGTTPMIATGLLWFVGNFDGSHPAILD